MSVTSFFFGFVLIILLNSSCSLISIPTNGIYLIPKGYRGDVIILFNQPDGVAPEIENGLYVYKIPEDGVLKVKMPGVTGIVKEGFFL